MLKEISDAKNQSLKRVSVGLLSFIDLLSVFDIIIYSTVSPQGPTFANTNADFLYIFYKADNTTLRFLSSYAKGIVTLKIGKVFMAQIVGFRILVFVSICYILLYYGVEKGLINQVIREYISNLDGKNLDRLCSSALWVNRIVATLAPILRYRVSKIFVLYKYQSLRGSTLIILANFQQQLVGLLYNIVVLQRLDQIGLYTSSRVSYLVYQALRYTRPYPFSYYFSLR